MRLHFSSLGAIALLGSSLAAHADTIYNFTLTSTQGYSGGSGSFALNVPPPSAGTVAYSFAGGGPYTVGDKIDSFVESYTPPPGAIAPYYYEYPISGNLEYIQFTDGMLSRLNAFRFDGGGESCESSLTIGITSYNFGEVCLLNGGFGPPVYYSDAGAVVITPAAGSGVTPEPSGMVLMATAMLGMVGVLRRRVFE